MKKRRTFLGLFMLLSLAFVGVGYAALTNTLTVNGTLNATKNDENLNVQFVASKAAARTSTGAEDTSFTVTHSASDKTATVNINGINELNSYAEVCYVIQNNSLNLGDSVLDAYVNTTLDIKMVGGSGQATDKDTNDVNTFTGDHFKVEGEITTTYDAYNATYAGSITADNDQTKGLDLPVGKVCFLKVKVTLVAPVLDTIDTHTFTITFNASTEQFA